MAPFALLAKVSLSALLLSFALPLAVAQAYADCPEDDPDAGCLADESDILLFGQRACVRLQSAGEPCAPASDASEAVCERGLVCNANGVCGKAAKGDLCTDDRSVCSDGLTCLRAQPGFPPQSGGPRPFDAEDLSPRVCKREGVPEGEYCSQGSINTANLAPPGTWRPGIIQGDSVARGALALDLCADGLRCESNRCVQDDGGFFEENFPDPTNLVPIGAFCDGQGAVCPEVNVGWMTSLRLVREVPTACVSNVCVSVDPEYRVGQPCSSGCGTNLQCGDDGKCVDAQPWVYGNLAEQPVNMNTRTDFGVERETERTPRPVALGDACPFGWCEFGAFCRDGVCVSGDDVSGGLTLGEECNDGECADGLVCEDVVGDNLFGGGRRCTSKNILDGAYCEETRRREPPGEVYAIELSQTCMSGSAACQLLVDARRCAGLRTRGQRCGVYETRYCVDGTSCIHGTCVD